ncbi:MAG: PKD domain-containing protein [Planctomycetota bacterium]|jgi:murein DD-endopeptidase MepM/ murein hydrolase activator NlpD
MNLKMILDITRSQRTIIVFIVLALHTETAFAKVSQTNLQYQTLNSMVSRYSKQKIICLDIGEEYSFKLKDGSIRVIRLKSVKEYRDSVIGRIRRAEIDVEIDGKPLHLACAPYVMPTESNGIRIQADTTSGWLPLPKQVQFSIWDSADPIVDTKLFVFPIPKYSLFSHGIQCYNEVVHLGRHDGDPQGPNFYHNYGIDIAGYEGKETIVSCTDGKVILFWPSRKKLCSVVIQDENGFFWEYGHLDSVMPNIKKGVSVTRGQKIGMLGKTGPSGNFSHLHLGTYLSKSDLDADVRNRRLNLYPWIVAAYQAQYQESLYAVAGPHHVITTGQKVVFDGSNSLAFKTKIASYKWDFHDGQTVNSIKAEKRFDMPGVYIATLWIKDENGNQDVDFCRVKVFTKSAPEDRIPTIFMTYNPSAGILVNQPIFFRFWLQAKRDKPLKVNFGNGTIIDNYASYSEVTHRFKTAGIHIVTAQTIIDDKPITQKQKIVVQGHVSE